MKLCVAATVLFFGIGIIASPALATVFEYEQFNQGWETANYDPEQGAGKPWFGDRKAPTTVDAVLFDNDYRLHFGIVGNDQHTDPFYQTEGIKHAVAMPEYGFQSFSVDLWIGSAQEYAGTNNRYAGLWGVGRDGQNQISAYPILQYRHKTEVTAGFYSYDYVAGDWSDVLFTLDSDDFSQWYNLRIDLSVGNGVSYYLNGAQVGSLFGDTYTTDLETVILNVGNYGVNQDYYWDNFQANAVPEPGSMVLLGFGLCGIAAAGWIRRSKK